jgi:hypothetical protein
MPPIDGDPREPSRPILYFLKICHSARVGDAYIVAANSLLDVGDPYNEIAGGLTEVAPFRPLPYN